MNSRQRILRVLRGASPDRIPWIPLLSPTYFTSLPEYQSRFGPTDSYWMPDYDSLDQTLEDLAFRVAYCRSLGVDYMDWGGIGFRDYEVIYDGVSVCETEEGDTRLVCYETPVGSLSQARVLSRDAKTVFPVTSLLRSPQDYRVYGYMLEHSIVRPLYERTRRCLETIGDAGVAFMASPSAPAKDWVLSEMLLEDLVYALNDHPDEFAEVEALAHARNREIYRLQAASPAEVYIDYAVTGTGMVSPCIYRDHYLPFHQECAEIYHRAGKVYLDHTSGEPLRGILAMVAVSGTDGLYGVSLPEFGHGDATLAEIRLALGPDVTIIAGIEPHLLATSTVEEVKEVARYVLDQCARIGGRVMLGTADDVPYGAPPRNIASVSEVAEERGRDLRWKP